MARQSNRFSTWNFSKNFKATNALDAKDAVASEMCPTGKDSVGFSLDPVSFLQFFRASL